MLLGPQMTDNASAGLLRAETDGRAPVTAGQSDRLTLTNEAIGSLLLMATDLIRLMVSGTNA